MKGRHPFTIHPQIVTGTLELARLPICDARLEDDARWPWIVLIPRRADASEIEDLSTEDRAQLLVEIILCGEAVREIGQALGRPVEKLNVAALGNVVAQLHVHVVGRRANDPAWPGPVWGVGGAVSYEPDAAARALGAARAALLR